MMSNPLATPTPGDRAKLGTLAPESILVEAERIVNGPRAEAYGHPLPNHAAIAELWEAFLANKAALNPGPLTPQEAGLMMILLKIARLQFMDDHRDSLVDICGYAACIEKMNARQAGEPA